jgi:hypothetical protein
MSDTTQKDLSNICSRVAKYLEGEIAIKDYFGEIVQDQELSKAAALYQMAYDHTFIISAADGGCQAARVYVALGGPTVWIDTEYHEVRGYWGGDRVRVPYGDRIKFDEYVKEIYESECVRF